MSPILNKLATDSQGYVRVVKVDADSNTTLAERYDVEGVPGFVLFKEGKAINGIKGEMTQPELTKWVKQELDMPTD
jgi:thioredoxin-like negative regulator of GroEL